MSYKQLLSEETPKKYPIDAVGVGIYLSIAVFAAFVLTGLANGVGITSLHLQTIFAIVIMVLFPTIGIVARTVSQGKDVYTKERTPFRTAEGPTIVLVGMLVVFIAEFFTLKFTPNYTVFSTDLTGLLFGFITPLKLFYTFMGFSEEIFFRFGLQAYTERETHSPIVGIVISGVVFSAYHQFVYGLFSFVILAAGLALAVIYYYYPNVAVLAGIHGLFNLVLS